MHLKKFNFIIVFANQKQTSGTNKAINEQIHQQAALISLKIQIL